jgi:hypothetical protein
MSNANKIRQAIKKISQSPADIKRILDTGAGGRKSELVKALGQDYSRDEVAQTLREILSKAQAGGASSARPVEWIGAAATLAAGALAA